MTKRIRIGIAGYGKLGKGTETAIMQNEDMELVAVVTRRDPSCLNLKTKNALAVSMSDIETLKDRIDVMVICCGSATDLPEMSPKLAGMFNVIDSFDTHQNIPKHFEAVDISAKAGGHIALISAGWIRDTFPSCVFTRHQYFLRETIIPFGVRESARDTLMRSAGSPEWSTRLNTLYR